MSMINQNENSINNRIDALRQLMCEHNIDAYIVPTADYHQSEMVGDHFKCREWLTGFTGSAGTAVITADFAGLWTDGRYFIQAEQELAGSGIELMRDGEPDVPRISEWLQDNLAGTSTLGFDGRTLSLKEGRSYKGLFQIVSDCDLVGELWSDRPELSGREKAWLLDESYSGESTSSKLARIRNRMNDYGADYHLITSLDDICWILNIRGNDIACSPLVLSYLVIGKEGADYYVAESKLDVVIKKHLADCKVTIHPYEDIYKELKWFGSSTILLDPGTVNYELGVGLAECACELIEAGNPSELMKAIKNDVELEHIRMAHRKDGVAVAKFANWVKSNYSNGSISEISAADKFREFRMQQDGYIEDSFGYIIAYGEHGAIVHYSATDETNSILNEGLLLTDTGAHYMDGTTDISRTIVLGSVSDEIRRDYTAVLRGFINLHLARFPYGCYGFNLDAIAREPLWKIGKDYKHGTGHGVGYLLNVHEGPHGLRYKVRDLSSEHILEPGMVMSIEPGCYEAGKYGIRIENLVVVRRDEEGFMYFEPLTMAPIDCDAVDYSMMTDDEIAWLKDYNDKCEQLIKNYQEN